MTGLPDTQTPKLSSPPEIVAACAAYWGVKPSQVYGPGNCSGLIRRARYGAMWALDAVGLRVGEIGAVLRLDHSVVNYAFREACPEEPAWLASLDLDRGIHG